MALEYGDIVYNPTGMIVAPLNNDNTYGTPQVFEYIGDFNFQFETDEDEIMTGGFIAETLSIVKRATGTIKDAALNWPALTVLAGLDPASEEGSEPNRIKTLDIPLGGAGLPYFGAIARYEATVGANLLVGFPKAKLSTIPGFTVAQNKFRTGEANMKMVGTSLRKLLRFKKYETAAAIPSDANGFDTFFAGMLS